MFYKALILEILSYTLSQILVILVSVLIITKLKYNHYCIINTIRYRSNASLQSSASTPQVTHEYISLHSSEHFERSPAYCLLNTIRRMIIRVHTPLQLTAYSIQNKGMLQSRANKLLVMQSQ